MKDISVIIVNYNNSKLLEECLISLYSSTNKATLEVIVADNASTDDSVHMVKTLFPEVKVIENKQNLGFIKATNQGLRIYSGRYALLLNDDTVVKDGAIDKMLKFMNKNPKAGACGPKLLNKDGTIQRQGSLLGKRFWLAPKPKEIGFLVGACLMVRRETIDKVGILDENFFFYTDDLDWCKRIKKAGWKIYFLPEPEVIHYKGWSSTRVFNKRLFVEGFRGGLYFCRKHYGLIAYIIYRLFLLISAFLAAILTALSCPFRRNKIEAKQRTQAYWKIFKICVTGKIRP